MRYCPYLNFFHYYNSVQNERKVSPKIIRANISENAMFKCSSSVQPEWVYSESDALPLEQTILSNDYTYSVTEIGVCHTGYYWCFGYDNNSKKNFTSRGFLKVYGITIRYSLYETMPLIILMTVKFLVGWLHTTVPIKKNMKL